LSGLRFLAEKVPKRNVKKNNEGIFKNYEGILKIPS
jgi:hypothetical protein